MLTSMQERSIEILRGGDWGPESEHISAPQQNASEAGITSPPSTTDIRVTLGRNEQADTIGTDADQVIEVLY